MILRLWNIFKICILFNGLSKTEADNESSGIITHLCMISINLLFLDV